MPTQNITFPLGGVDRRGSVVGQAPGTTMAALNVRPFQSISGRAIGGVRPFLIQYPIRWDAETEQVLQNYNTQLVKDVYRIPQPADLGFFSIHENFRGGFYQRLPGWTAPSDNFKPWDAFSSTIRQNMDDGTRWHWKGVAMHNAASNLNPKERYEFKFTNVKGHFNTWVSRGDEEDPDPGDWRGDWASGEICFIDRWWWEGGQELIENPDLQWWFGMWMSFEFSPTIDDTHYPQGSVTITPKWRDEEVPWQPESSNWHIVPRGTGIGKYTYPLSHNENDPVNLTCSVEVTPYLNANEQVLGNTYSWYVQRVSGGRHDDEWGNDKKLLGQENVLFNKNKPPDQGGTWESPRRVGFMQRAAPLERDDGRENYWLIHNPTIGEYSVNFVSHGDRPRETPRTVLVVARGGEVFRQDLHGENTFQPVGYDVARSGAYLRMPNNVNLDSADRLSDLFIPYGPMLYSEDEFQGGVVCEVRPENQGGSVKFIFKGVKDETSRRWEDVADFLPAPISPTYPTAGSTILIKASDIVPNEGHNLGVWAVEDGGYIPDDYLPEKFRGHGFVQVKDPGGVESGAFAVDTTTRWESEEGRTPAEIWYAPRVYQSGKDLVTTWVTDRNDDKFPKGHVPSGCTIIQRYRDRIVLSGKPDDPTNWWMSRKGDPYDFDYFPLGADRDTTKAVSGQTSEAGAVREPITALISYTDDYMLIGTPKSLWKLIGDPAYGGQIDNLSHEVGIVSNSAWCHGPSGEVLWLSDDGVYGLPPGASAFPAPVSRGHLPDALRNVNPNQTNVQMQYDSDHHGVLISLGQPDGSSGTSWWLDWETKTWWPEHYSRSSPNIIAEHRDEDPGLSGLIIATKTLFKYTSDGVSYSHRWFDEVPYIVLGPVLLGGATEMDGIITELFIEEGQSQEGKLGIQIYTGHTAFEAHQKVLDGSAPAWSGLWDFAKRHVMRPRVRGLVAYIKLGGVWVREGDPTPWFSLERLQLKTQPAGMTRAL